MAILNCRICGEGIEVKLNNSDTTVDCEHCGHEVTIPCEIPSEHIADLFNEGNALRMAEEYDKAAEVHKRIIDESDPEWDGLAEAHWRLALCYHGVIYPKHPVTEEYEMMVRRDGGCLMIDDPDYIRAYELSGRWRYKEVAEKITELQKAGPDYAAPSAEKRETYYTRARAKDGKDITADFTDPKFREVMLEKLKIGKHGTISDNDVKNLTELSVRGKDIASLAGIEHFTALEELICSGNRLTSLDLSKNVSLKYINCNENRLTSLVLPHSKKLRQVECDENRLTGLDISVAPYIEKLSCRNNVMKSEWAIKGLRGMQRYKNEPDRYWLGFVPQLPNDDSALLDWWKGLDKKYQDLFRYVIDNDSNNLQHFNHPNDYILPTYIWNADRAVQKRLKLMLDKEEITENDYAVYLERRKMLGINLPERVFLGRITEKYLKNKNDYKDLWEILGDKKCKDILAMVLGNKLKGYKRFYLFTTLWVAISILIGLLVMCFFVREIAVLIFTSP